MKKRIPFSIKGLKSIVSRTWIVRYLHLKILFHKSLNGKLKKQLHFQDAGAISPAAVTPQKIFIPLIETSHYQFYQILGLAKALQVRGAEIKLLLCGSYLEGCELKSVRSFKTDPCLTCRFNKTHTASLFEFDTIFLADVISNDEASSIGEQARAIVDNYPDKYIYEGFDIIPVVNDSVIRYYYGAMPDEHSPEVKEIRRQHLETVMLNYVSAKKIYAEWKPDIVMCNMNVYSAWEPYFRMAEQLGIQHSIVSMSTFDFNAVVLNRLDIYKNSKRFDSWAGTRTSTILAASEKKQLDNFLNTRFTGNSRIFVENSVFDKQNNVSDKLQIDKNKRNIFLFTNIYWDVGLSETGSLYNGVIDWVLDTIELVHNLPDCHVYIKTHPAEVFDSSPSLKGVIQFIMEKYPVLPDNITIIPPEYKIKTYDLFPYIDMGVVYNGTLGLEMLINEIPVVVTGLAPYSYLKSVSCPSNISEYKELLSDKDKVAKLDYSEVELFAYFYFVKSLIPWTLTKQSYSSDFTGFSFNSLEELLPGENKYLDHLCNCILDAEHTVVEDW